MKSKKYPKWFYLVMAVIPVIVILLLELGLRIGNYGKDLNQWIEITENDLILNPEIGARYFSNTKNYPHSNHDPFAKDKKENTFRIFIFGGSSAAGFPFQPNGSFSRYLRDRLEMENPEKFIEVVNLSITAVNSITIRDLLPGVIEKKPDLIIIYAGHNEFYGALGIGSTETIGSNSFLIRTYLYLLNFRITQLIRDMISKVGPINDKNPETAGRTLMARMAEERSIKLDSDLYRKGREQFQNNLEFILSHIKENNIPLIIGTLPSNILDQPPFYSFDEDTNYSANYYYTYGKELFSIGNIAESDSILNLAKDHDGLRFRATSEFNRIIKELALRHDFQVADIEERLKEYSKNKIIGNDLMTDHLHPTLEGHFIIGRLFLEEIRKLNFHQLNSLENSNSDNHQKVIQNFAFSKLDSLAAEYRLINLLNDWPFTEGKNNNALGKLELKTKIDSLAMRMVKENYNWEAAHQDAYTYYLSNNQIENFVKEMHVLSSQYPYKLNYYNFAAEELIKRKYYGYAEDFLFKRYRIEPDAFSTKWLGNISLYNNKNSEAINYLRESLNFEENDPQTYYNLAIAYLKLKEYKESFQFLQKSLALNPENNQARRLIEELNKKAGY